MGKRVERRVARPVSGADSPSLSTILAVRDDGL